MHSPILYPLDVTILMIIFLSPEQPTACTSNPLQIDTVMYYKLSAIRQECKVTIILMRDYKKNNVITGVYLYMLRMCV